MCRVWRTLKASAPGSPVSNSVSENDLKQIVQRVALSALKTDVMNPSEKRFFPCSHPLVKIMSQHQSRRKISADLFE